jgi:hypothetical protein
MRQIVYRTLAGAVVIAAGYAAFRTISDRDFTTGFPFGILNAILGLLLIVPTFTVYALYGEKAGNRVVVPLVNPKSARGIIQSIGAPVRDIAKRVKPVSPRSRYSSRWQPRGRFRRFASGVDYRAF